MDKNVIIGIAIGSIVIVGICIASFYVKTETPLKPNQKLLTKEMYGDKWALVVDSGILEVREKGAICVFICDGFEYAVNGFAKTYYKDKRYPHLENLVMVDTVEMKRRAELGIDTTEHPAYKDFHYIFKEMWALQDKAK